MINNNSKEMYRGSCRKGQFFSYDAMIAGILFVILLAILYVYWSSMRSIVFTQIDDMFRVSLAASNLLLSPGNPSDWNASTYKQIGLTSSFNSLILDETKVEQFRILANSSYDDLRSRLGVAPYEFYVTVNNKAMGIQPGTNIKGRFSIVRPVIYRGFSENLTVTIWSNFSFG